MVVGATLKYVGQNWPSISIILHKKIYPDSFLNTKKLNCSWSISIAGTEPNKASFGRRILRSTHAGRYCT
jgi:hypothetical protein